MTDAGPHRRRHVRNVLVGLLIFFLVALLVARWYFSGPKLGEFLNAVLFEGKVRGRVHIGSIDWPFIKLVGRRIPATVHDVQIYDEHGHLTLDVPELTCTIDWLTAALPPHDVIVDDLEIPGGRVFVEEEPTGDPLHPWEPSFVNAFQPKVVDPRPPEERHDAPGPIIEVRTLHVEHIDLMLTMHGWNAYLHDVETRGTLRQSFRRPQVMDFSFVTAPTAKLGMASFAKMMFILTDFRANRFGQYPEAKDSLEFSALATTVEGAHVEAVGHLDHIYEKEPGKSTVALEVDAKDGGILARRLSKGLFGGGHPAGHLAITGPMIAPRMDWSGRGLPSALVPITVDHSVGSLRLATLDAEFKETEVHGLGGRAELKGKANLEANVLGPISVAITDPMDLSQFLPREVVRETGGELSGSLHVLGLPPFAWIFDRAHLQLGRLGIHGSARLLGSLVRTSDLTLTLPDARASLWGQVDLAGKKINIEGRASAARLGAILGRLGLPALAKSIEVPHAEVRGTFARPVISADAIVLGTPMVPQVATGVTYTHAPGGGKLDIRRLDANPFGGSVSGRGQIQLGARPSFTALELDVSKLDLAKLPGGQDLLAGSVDLHVRASGPMLRPEGNLDLDVSDLRLGGHAVGAGQARLVFDERRGFLVKRFHIGDAAGSLDVTGSFGLEAPRPVDLRLQLTDVPLSILPEATPKAARPLALGGRASADLHVGGSLDRPVANGRAAVAGLAIWDTLFGSGQLELEVQKDNRVHFTGRFFHGKLAIAGSVAVRNYTEVDLTARVTFTELELAEVFYDTAKKLGADGWISGTLDVKTQPSLTADLHVERLRFDLSSGDERLPLTISNHGAIDVHYDGPRELATLAAPMRLASPTGELLVEGSASPAALALHLRGDLQLRLLEPYVRRWVDRATGSLTVDVSVGGNAARPTLDGKVAVKDAAVVPREQEDQLRIPRGAFNFSLAKADVVGLVVEVDGQELTIEGTLGLVDLKPARVDATVRGRLAGRLVQMFAPQQVTHASGSALFQVAAHGDFAAPRVTGALEIDQTLELALRSLRRDVLIRSGHAEIDNGLVVIDARNPLRGTMDEGSFTVAGRAQLVPLKVNIHADVQGLVQKIPDQLSVELNASLDASLENDKLALAGLISVVDGRYFANLRVGQVIQSALIGRRTIVTSEPFWKDSPLLATMDLRLEVETKNDSFTINNNVAHNVRLAGSVIITGTPPNPHLDGEVAAAGDGTITIPFISRIHEFSVTDGKVSFSGSKRVPDQTPTVIVHADAPFVDAAGVEHRVFLEVSGNLQNLDWDLHTSTGLNRVETLSLITTGRTPDELRAQARGDAARGPVIQTSSSAAAASPGSGSAIAAATDEVIQAVTGDVISSLLQDPLRGLTSFDVTFSFGADSVRASFHKALGAIVELNGEYERATTWYRGSANLNFRAADNLTLNVQFWFFKPPEEAEGAQNAFRLQLKYHVTIP